MFWQRCYNEELVLTELMRGVLDCLRIAMALRCNGSASSCLQV